MRSRRGLLAIGATAGALGTVAVLPRPVAAVQANALTRAERHADAAGAPLRSATRARIRGATLLTHGTSVSTNWSGYAVHRSHLRFRKISAAWTVPSGTCASGTATYSAFWVGLGGYKLNSHALEQIGTEFDCTAAGRPKLFAWYELVPAASRRVRMRIAPGDLMLAKVVVAGRKVRLTLTDSTRAETFKRTLRDRSADTTSAEWIAEAPSECLDVSRCQILPLADFGSIAFTNASAETAKFHSGAISSHRWKRTKILLGNTYGGRYVSNGSGSALATPSGLSDGGRAFTISYTGPASSSGTGSSDGSGGGSTTTATVTRPRSAGG